MEPTPARPSYDRPGQPWMVLLCAAALLMLPLWLFPARPAALPADRQAVVFWHFWGGADRAVVEDVVARFNAHQDRYFVRAVAMPGNNLDLKLFLAVTGGEPPDLINQDDPIVADWARRGALTPLDELASPAELRELEAWLVPAADRLGRYGGRRYALCNGLDIRALYYNKTLLDQAGLAPPQTIEDLDRISERLTVRNGAGRFERFGYLPDARRLWAWGIVFGGRFYDADSSRVTADDAPVVAALDWMTTYRERYGSDVLKAFRQGDQSLPGKPFPLLAGRYAVIMDGQWRVRDVQAARRAQMARGERPTEYGVCPLPAPPGGRPRAGWVNGNFFLVPRGAGQPQGAWEFMKFWCGFAGHEAEAAETCVAGGWIPVSRRVTREPLFQEYLEQAPLFAQFVALSAEPHQVPTPVIPGAPYYYRTLNTAVERTLYTDGLDPRSVLHETTRNVQQHLDRVRGRTAARGPRP